MLTESKNNIAAIILSGGQGSRLGGKDKGLQKYNDKALVAWVIEAIRTQVDTTILSINRNIEAYTKFNLPTVVDESNGEYHGPIAGILSASKVLISQDSSDQHIDYLLIASCDSPNLPDDYVDKLHQTIFNSDLDVVIVNDGQRNQNLHCLIKTTAISHLQNYYENNGRSMYGWFQQMKYAEVDFSERADCFVNINRESDLVK